MRGTTKRTPMIVTEEEAISAVKILHAYLDSEEGATYKAAKAASKTIMAYIRQIEAGTRSQAKRLGVKGNPSDIARKWLPKDLKPMKGAQS